MNRSMAFHELVLGILLFSILFMGIFYVLYGISHSRALKALGYARPWMAWIPLANYWALAEAAMDGEENVVFFSTVSVSTASFRLWWLFAYVVSLVPGVGTILNIAMRVICLGTCYIKVYARLNGKTEAETQVLGYVSGFLPIIAVVKFLMGHYDG